MTQPPTPPNQQPRQLRLEIPANLTADYANGAVIMQTPTEIILDFVQIFPNDPRARVQRRIALTPTAAKLFLQALQTNLERFEQQHGEIKTPPTLADQLFGAIKPDQNEG